MWYSTEGFCCCSNQWAEVVVVLEVPLICFSPFERLLKESLSRKMKIVFIYLHLTALALSRRPDFSSFPLAGWWFGSLAKKKVWQRNPCSYGGRQPFGCRYAYVRVHWHAVLHAVFTSAGFLAKFQGHRYLLAVSDVDFTTGTSERSLVCCFAAFLVLPMKFILFC